MGPDQAAGVLATVTRTNYERQGKEWSAEDDAAFKQPTINQFEEQSDPYFATSRLWDDGLVDPVDARMTLGLAISAALNRPVEDTKFGVFRM